VKAADVFITRMERGLKKRAGEVRGDSNNVTFERQQAIAIARGWSHHRIPAVF